MLSKINGLWTFPRCHAFIIFIGVRILMAQRPRQIAVSLAETLDLHVRHERVLTALGSDYENGIDAASRRQLLRLAHQKQRLLRRAGVFPSSRDDPLIS